MISLVVGLAMVWPGPRYTVRALGFKDQWALIGMAMNNRGDVTGSLISGSDKPGFRLIGQSIDTFGDGPNSRGRAIDDNGTVLGWSTDASFIWTKQGGVQRLDAVPGKAYKPQAISPNGILAGTLNDGSTKVSYGKAAGLWQPSEGFQPVPLPAGLDMQHGWVYVDAVNESGTVAATYLDSPRMAPLRLRADGSSAILPTAEGATASETTCINRLGWIGGHERGDHLNKGVLWSPQGNRVDVGDNVYILGVNDQEVAVGYRSGTPEGTAIVWDTLNGVRDLNSLINAFGAKLEQAVAINDRGQILCTGKLDDKPQSFVLTPVIG